MIAVQTESLQFHLKVSFAPQKNDLFSLVALQIEFPTRVQVVTVLQFSLASYFHLVSFLHSEAIYGSQSGCYCQKLSGYSL